ncbi:MAG TPA: hypothetical protein VK163_15905, partial [Opitutaceae bacterium]|nr:hypothetical protein [Opitutaceae bacterium]
VAALASSGWRARVGVPASSGSARLGVTALRRACPTACPAEADCESDDDDENSDDENGFDAHAATLVPRPMGRKSGKRRGAALGKLRRLLATRAHGKKHGSRIWPGG